MNNTQLKVDIRLSTVAALASILEPYAPDLYLKGLYEITIETFKKWQFSEPPPKKRIKYIKKCHKILKKIEADINFSGKTWACLFAFMFRIVDDLIFETNNKRFKHLAELSDMLRTYLCTLRATEKDVEQADALYELYCKNLETALKEYGF